GLRKGAESRQPDPEMADRGAPGGTRQPAGTADRSAERGAEHPGAFRQIGERADHYEQRKTDPERRNHRPAAFDRERRRNADDRDGERADEALRDAIEIAALPANQ